MEDVRVGFYAPDERYWETNSEPSEDTRAGYPEGTIEVPLRPDANHVWQDGAWVERSPPPLNYEGDLTPSEFRRVLNLTGLDDAWRELEQHYKDTNREVYADLQEQRLGRNTYRLSVTLSQIAIFMPVLTTLSASVGSQIDLTLLSDENIRAQWRARIEAR